MSKGRLLLVLPLRIYDVGGRYFTDTQACNGLRLWLENFDCLTLACPCEVVAEKPDSVSAIETVMGAGRITIVPLPLAYVPNRFLFALPKTGKVLQRLIDEADYLHFAIGGLWGDWASVGCLISAQMKRPYAVWTDHVESRVAEFHSKSKHGVRRLYRVLTAALMKHYERHIIRHADLGLFNGMDCYEAYAQYCKDPHVVHDIHLGPDDRISHQDFDRRLRKSVAPLKLVYAGRVHQEKGVYDWIEGLAIAARSDVVFAATWYGAGPELEGARALVKKLDLSSQVFFPGSLERSQILCVLREADAFIFCHKTLESPRCLIEALMSGLPIVGYGSGYSKDLIRNGGGLLTVVNEPSDLAELISVIADRTKLGELSRRALADGERFSDEAVFRHRSDLIKGLKEPSPPENAVHRPS